MLMDMQQTSWLERYHASEIYTLRCKVSDKPGMLGKLVAAVAADGRAINNALAYPGIFRGALDVRAKDITMNMQLAAARTLAERAPDGMLLPDMIDRETHRQVAKAVAEAYRG